MIFNFSIFGSESDIVKFEQKSMKILLRILEKNELLASEIHFCMHEAILNVIQHAHLWDSSKPIEIRIFLNDTETEKQIEISITDQGPKISQLIQIPDHIEKFQLRKRGLYMISQIMDEFSISPSEKTGNITKMKKVIPLNLLKKGSENECEN